MATSEVEDVDKKFLECTICLKQLQNPKSLKCLHSFCCACLEDWVKEKGELTCPTCSKSYSIPEGGLQNLTANIFIKNVLESIELFSNKDQMKCVCEIEGQAKYYCQDCRQFLCTTCCNQHKRYKLFVNHKLHAVEDVQSMSPLQMASINPALCLLHSNPLEFYCTVCETPICLDCTITEHSELEGKHKLIGISDAFQTFKETSAELEKAVNESQNKLQNGLEAVLQNSTKLEQSRETTLREIDEHVDQMIKEVTEKADKMKRDVEKKYRKEKAVNDLHMDILRTTILEIETQLSFLNQEN
ncbi:E3 ubiquitin-protein ligase TRIM33-like [Anneissia japonica]|uniref:E3 ubiquitin-protein ligase TRIM33-like n=1 Tax=Anneissia japonica TaxID=1529436 RepID=UPI001425A2E8|nr:E3 ubiquitin-protein ligase TRIM33-like [Anneissia japonica]